MNVLLGVTASVASKLTPKLVRELLNWVPEIKLKVIATERSLHFFRVADVSSGVAKRHVPVLRDADEWPEGGYVKDTEIPHIALGEWADVLLIAPLSANTLSDMAHGKTDTLLTSTVLAWPRKKTMILAPAMNTRMWENPITQNNLRTVLATYCARTIGPQVGDLACGTHGVGAMTNIGEIATAVLGERD